MRKLKVKPTPAQARILRALDQNLGLFLGFVATKGWWTGTNEAEIRRDTGEPRVPTLRRLLREEWIEPIDGDASSCFYTITASGKMAIADLSDSDFIPPAPKMPAYEVLEILDKVVFPAPWWMFVRELSVGDWRGHRRIDAFAMRVSSGTMPRNVGAGGISGGRLLISWALEIKVSREDFLRELAEPRKRIPAMDVAHRYSFVAPAGIIKRREVPEGCGLIEIDETKRVIITAHAAYAPPGQPDWRLVASIARAMMRMR